MMTGTDGLPRHADVRQQHLWRLDTLFKLRNSLASRCVAFKRNSLAREGLFQDPADGAIVVYDPDRFHIFVAHLVIGMTTTKARLKPARPAASA